MAVFCYPINMNEHREQHLSPERMKGEQVASMVKEVFDKFPFEVTQHLVDSNVVLTLAGMKGQTEFFIDVPDESQDERIIQGINELSQKLQSIDSNIIMRLEREPFPAASDGVRTMMVNVLNLSTLEEWIQKTKLCDLPKFDKSQGFAGFDKWREDVVEKFGEDSDEQEMGVGVRKGYPDQAILDFIDWYNTGREKVKEDAKILNTGLYDEAQPIYSYYAEHANDPEIVDNENRSSEILAGFYQSQWHKEIAPRLEFKKGRNLE